MIPVLTKEQAYKLDKDTIESGHLSQEELMDNAGKTVAQFFCEKIQNPFSKTVVVVCGKGNNGGDGVIAHSYLKKYNVSSKIVFTEENHGHSKLLKKYKISKSEYSIYSDKTKFDKYDWVIDGIFGIGLSRDLNNKYKKIIKSLNCNKNIISIDIQSGLCSDSDKYSNSVYSKHVVTFGYSKFGHYFNIVNDLNILNIGFKNINVFQAQLINYKDIEKLIKSKKINDNIHKYTRGKALIFAGSNDYPGAGILSAKAAKSTGSGYVKLFLESNNNNLITQMDLMLPEIIVSNNAILNEHKDIVCDTILFGPGYVSDLNSYTFLENLKNSQFF